ncbi:MAG TPA: GDSL-type esterase/lipase family protein [Candidatus Dormibacteraeota bacterium]|jgi:lysophospholipase L1-like esterase|nr:GDSL-type esterase/lipase family protein [Candidatus Dormibacteraeota bacterium]
MVGYIVLVAAIVLASYLIGLLATPRQTVQIVGQTVAIGAARPHLNLWGPGELIEFGVSIPLKLTFYGLLRPHLEIAPALSTNDLTATLRAAYDLSLESLGKQLFDGWLRYCLWLFLVSEAVCTAAIVPVAIAMVQWRGLPERRAVRLTVGCLLTLLLLNAGQAALATNTLSSVSRASSIDALVGRDTSIFTPAPVGPPVSGINLVVIGDSTAAGLGNELVSNPTPEDRACGRSKDSFAAVLANTNSYKVLNLACSTATIRAGVLGEQPQAGQTVSAQLGRAKQVTDATAIIVSVGANEMQWPALVQFCLLAEACDDNATTAFFDRNLSRFTLDFAEYLLPQLASLPQHPRVIINQYYDPFDPDVPCKDIDGWSSQKVRVLSARLATFNLVLAKGASTFGFIAVKPDFRGHELCTKQPYVQGLPDPAPLHPTAAGELAIALADQQALVAPPRRNETSP